MSKLEDDMIEQEARDSWLEQGEAVMHEMCDDDWLDEVDDDFLLDDEVIDIEDEDEELDLILEEEDD